jgi:hypothetical protein
VTVFERIRGAIGVVAVARVGTAEPVRFVSLNSRHRAVLALVRDGRVTHDDTMPDDDGYQVDGVQPDGYDCGALGGLLAAELIRRASGQSGRVRVELTDEGRTRL